MRKIHVTVGERLAGTKALASREQLINDEVWGRVTAQLVCGQFPAGPAFLCRRDGRGHRHRQEVAVSGCVSVLGAGRGNGYKVKGAEPLPEGLGDASGCQDARRCVPPHCGE